jgi:hypothetical protein
MKVQCFGPTMYLLEPKGGEGGRSVGQFHFLILSDTLAIVAVEVVRRGGGEGSK